MTPLPASPTAQRGPLWRRASRSRATGGILIVALLVLWECSARFGWVRSDNWPPVSEILKALTQGLAGGEIGTALLSTFYRMIVGYLIGCGTGIIIGLLLGANETLRSLVRPPIEAIRPIPAPAIIPPLILFLGIDDALKIFIVALASFFPCFVNTLHGVDNIDDVLVQTARTFRVAGWRKLTQVMLPAALPSIAAGLRTSISLALVVAVISEMIAGASGVGFYIVQMQYALKPQYMYAAVVCLAALGYTLNVMFLSAEKRFMPWIGRS